MSIYSKTAVYLVIEKRNYFGQEYLFYSSYLFIQISKRLEEEV